MAVTLFYFSGTGNSLKVSRDLARELPDASIVSIANVIGGNVDFSADALGVIYPVYMFGMPLIVKKFIRKINVNKPKYIFAIATYGSMSGNALGQTSNEIEAQGLKLSAAFAIKMPGNYIPLYGAISIENQNIMFREESLRIKEIALLIKAKQEKAPKKSFFIFNWIFSAINNFCVPRIPFMDKDFWVSEKCNGCGICVKTCPVNNIDLVGKKPFWQHRCEQCFACLHWCPQEAIQYGRKTAGKKRYRNPEIKLQDLGRS